MKSISLFSGIGGFDLGFQRAGIECDTVCEIDKNAQSILRRHFPRAKIFDDVKKIGKDTHEPKTVDVICGGFPCQDVSIAGKRAGIAGERSGLWFEFARIIDELEPGTVVIENVPGLLSSNRGRDFAVIVQWLAKRGYGVAWRVLDAQYFGVPQRRRRVFIVGSFGNGRAAEILFERESGTGNTPPSRETGEGTASTFTIRSGKEGGGKGYLEAKSLPMTLGGQGQYVNLASGADVAPTLVSSYATKWGLGNQEAFSGDYFVLSSGQANASIDKNISPVLTSHMATGNSPLVFGLIDESTLKIGNDVFPTLRARELGGGSIQSVASENFGVRRLTPTECERLQGFPDGWTDGQSDTQRYRQLGNAVAVPVAEWIGRRIAS